MALPALACWPHGSASTSATAGESSATTTTTAGETTGGDTEATETAATETGGLPPGFWPGVDCPEDDAERPRVYFDLEAGKDPSRDFFRLPFPNDARRVGGGLDLDGFPEPPADLDPAYGVVVDRWLKHLRYDTPGFAVNGAALFRSSSGIAELAGIYYVDITPGSPNYGEKVQGLHFRAENGSVSRGNYICPNWLAVELVDGVPLRPATTYAVLLSDALLPVGADAFVPDDDFTAMLGAAAPADPKVAAAWERFAPLRDFLASPANKLGLSQGSLVGGTVFTTAPNHEPFTGAGAVVDDAPFYVDELHVCAGGEDSPCSLAAGLSDDERAERRCGPASDAYHEIHGRMRIPIFQDGVAPYVSVGGAIAIKGGGPVIASTDDVCFAMTVPKQDAIPENGWPVLVYADGTSGSFRGAVRSSMAARVAAGGVATIALEPVLHGERRNDDDGDGLVGGLDIYQLVFNVFNPESARDTLVQGALDQLSVIRFADLFTDDALLPGAAIRFDGETLAFMGHSLGANSGALILPFAPSVRAAVLSGGGSNLPQALLAKEEPKVQNPVTMQWMAPRELLQAAFQERPDRPLTAAHPMLILLNTFVNRSDGDNTSRHLRREPLAGAEAKHLLDYIGHVDSYAPLRSAGSLAVGAGVQVAPGTLFPPPCEAYEGAERTACGYTANGWLPSAGLPAQGNVGGVTAVARMLDQPPDKDGHFVIYEVAELDRAASFIIDALHSDAAPIVP
ncbi:MAG: hypothetical protein R3A79_20040 [Nannocystaceae bacterium]